jgi:hypothetical protein
MRFRDIPQFPRAGYQVNVSWSDLRDHIDHHEEPRLNLEPDYQRGHVWTKKQQIAYVEYGLMGGESSMTLTSNCPGWMRDFRGPYELVDGLQRVTAVLRFLDGDIPAFGGLYREYTDRLTITGPSFLWRVMSLPTRAEVLRLYLLINAGGVVHSEEEIERVRNLLDDV